MTFVGEAVALAGALLTLLAAIGLVRYQDALARMHIVSKATSLGFVLLAIGTALSLRSANDITSVLLAAGLQILTMPVAANLIGRSTYMAEGIPGRVDSTDELAAARSRVGDATTTED